MKSVLRYPGGKTRAIKHLLPLIPKGDICSPFIGGGSLELAVIEDRKVYAYDAFYPLYNFWNCLLNDREQLVNEIRKLHPLDKQNFTELRKSLRDCDENKGKSVEMAAAYFAINRCSFSGATLSGGFSLEASEKRFNENSIKRVENFVATNLTVGYNSFERSIEQHKEHFLFLDPPYYLGESSKLYGNSGDMHYNFNHSLLHEILTNRTNWLLCYNDCDFIRELYKDYEIIDAKWSYGMNKTKKSSEIIILSK